MDEESLLMYTIAYCKGELTEEDYVRLKQWVAEKEENQEKFEHLLQSYKRGRRVGCWQAVDERQAWEQISGRIVPVVVRPPWRIWWRYAAVLILLVSSGALYYFLQIRHSEDLVSAQIEPGRQKAILRLSDGSEYSLNPDTTYMLTEENGARIEFGGQEHITYHVAEADREHLIFNTIIVPRGGEYSLILADGSKVWLNAESELTYPAVFAKGERKVKLKGEACFEVVKDSLRPFIVESRYNQVEVLGTRFNISAYNDYDPVRTTLIRGKVRVSNEHETLVLNPGQQSVCHKEDIEIRDVDTDVVVAWVHGTFEFENMSLGEITDQLGRWYNVHFLYMAPELREITFTGAATRYRELEFILSMLEQLAEVHFIVKGNAIQVVKR